MMYTMLGSGYTVGKVTDMEEKRQVCVCVCTCTGRNRHQANLMRPAQSECPFAGGLNVNLNQNPHGNTDKTV